MNTIPDPKHVNLSIRPLTTADAPALSEALNEDPDHVRHYAPFDFDPASLRREIEDHPADRYWCIRVGDEVAGMFMLRGWQEGYEIPSYGVFVGRRWSGRGLGRLTLAWCAAWCRINGVARIMLKVHQENRVAQHLYEDFGFVREGTTPADAYGIYYFDL